VRPSDYTGSGRLIKTGLLAALCIAQDQALHTLLDAGAEIDAIVGETSALSFAAELEVPDKISLLLSRGADINANCGHALQVACMHGKKRSVQCFMSHGADLNVVSVTKTSGVGQEWVSYRTPALYAAQNGHLEILQLLHSKGAQLVVKQADRMVTTALHASAQADGAIACSKWLLAQGLAADVRDNNDSTALHLASVSDCLETMKLFLAHNADVNAVSTATECPLLAAVSCNSTAAVELLMQQPSLRLCDEQLQPCQAAWQLAAKKGQIACMSPLVASSHWRALTQRQRTMCQAKLLGAACDLTTIEAILQLPDVDLASMVQYRDRSAGNALHNAAGLGRPVQVICKLLKLGVDCTAKTAHERFTPADVARQYGNPLLAQLLDRAAKDQTQ